MLPTENHIRKLRSADGVLDLSPMDSEVSNSVWVVERDIKTQTGLEYINEGYDEAMGRDIRVCLFCDPTFDVPEEGRMYLKCEDGTILGNSVYSWEMETYACRDDVIWVSEDFVVYPYARGCGRERFVLSAKPFPYLEGTDECRDAIVTVPTGAADIILKGRYGVENRREISTVVVAYNVR